MFVNTDKFKSVDQRRELVRHTQCGIGELIMEGVATDEFDANVIPPENRSSYK